MESQGSPLANDNSIDQVTSARGNSRLRDRPTTGFNHYSTKEDYSRADQYLKIGGDVSID